MGKLKYGCYQLSNVQSFVIIFGDYMNHNKIVLFLKLGVFWNLLIIFSFFVFEFIGFLAPEPIEISLKTLTPIFIIISTVFTIFLYNQLKNQIHAIEYDVEGISKKFLLFDYYSIVLPKFLITFGISALIVSIVYKIILLAILGLLTFEFGVIFFIITNYAVQDNLSLKLSLDLSYMVFMKYLYTEEITDPFFINKFIYFFEKYLKKVDGALFKGTKISNLTVEDDNLSIRNIILYLPPFIKYGNQYGKDMLKKSLINMRELINEDNKLKSLKITTCILEIYKSEKKFVLTYNYQVETISPLTKLYDDIKNPLIVIFGFLLILIMVIIKSPLITNSMLDFLLTDGMEKILQPIAVVLTSFLGLIVAIFGIIIPLYTRK